MDNSRPYGGRLARVELVYVSHRVEATPPEVTCLLSSLAVK